MSGRYSTRQTDALEAANALRKEAGVAPLEMDDILVSEADKRAKAAAAKGGLPAPANRGRELVQAGAHSRFALSIDIETDKIAQAVERFKTDPLVKSKLVHPRVTHVGFGFAKGEKRAFTVVDLARLVAKVDVGLAEKTITDRLEKKREANSVALLELKDNLSARAKDIATGFMSGKGTSEALVAEAQKALGGENFSMGRVTFAFQVATDLNEVVIPPRTSDPGLAYAGVGIAQGNHDAHEPGAIAVVILLAEPQKAHDSRKKLSNLAPPKPVRGRKAAETGSLVDQAWVATLSGNHKRAAGLFKRAYLSTKKPAILYEAARAYARDEQFPAALSAMQQYAQLVEGKDRDKALAMAAKLEKRESIFSTAQDAQMSVEATRFFVMGQTLFEKKEWGGAIDAFQQAYTYTKHPDIIYNIGLAHCRAGRIGDALVFFAEYQKSVQEVNSVDKAKQLFNIGTELYLAGQFEAASTNFAMAYSYAPFPELIFNLALCHLALHQDREALRFLREFLHSDPSGEEKEEADKMMADISARLKK